MNLTWKVMVFFAGQNRLAEDMVYSLKDMKSVGSGDGLTLLAQYSAKWTWKRQSSATSPATPLRFKISADPNATEKWVIGDYLPPTPTQRPIPVYVDELVDFILWGLNEAPVAKRNMVILSGDGGGPLANFLPSLVEEKKIKPFELHKVFEQVWKKTKKRIDVVGLDSCSMSTAEIGYELRRYVDVLVSSQGNEDDIGWPYRDFLTRFRRGLAQAAKNNRPFESRDVAELAIDRYNSYFADYAIIAKTSANLSGLRLTAFDRLASAVTQFVKASNKILPPPPKQPVLAAQNKPTKADNRREAFARILVRAHWVAQTYRDGQYVDIFDFADNLINEIRKSGLEEDDRFKDVVTACESIKAVICAKESICGSSPSDLVIKSCYVGSKYQYSRGLSIYFPWNIRRDEYLPYTWYHRNQAPLDFFRHSFPRETGWVKFVDRYLHATRQRPRYDTSLIDAKYRQFFTDRDPPEGRGLGGECDSGQNPPVTWVPAECLPDRDEVL